ncbi:MAG: LuxR C-terminal-related transcriptional regulator, partial [Candidatus Kryptoniota bacterium]
FSEAVQLASGNTYSTLLVSAYLGKIQEADNQLFQAAETYRRSLQLMSEMGPPNASEEYIGLARIHYEWNDLDTAEQYGQQGLHLARQYDPAIDRYIDCEIFLSRLKLARGDIAGAAAMLAETEQSVLRNNFMHRIPEVAAAQVLVFLKQRNLSAAAHLAQAHKLPLSQARVELALGDPPAALAFLEPLRREMEVKGWQEVRLKVMVLQALALHLHGEKEKALDLLGEALKLAEVGGFIRIFVDEGEQMQWMLDDFRFSKLKSYPHLSTYLDILLAAFPSRTSEHPKPETQRIIEPLTQREVEILKLITQGLSNREIGERLFLALDTVKGHNRRIFEKLQVQRRTEAIARARELGLL